MKSIKKIFRGESTQISKIIKPEDIVLNTYYTLTLSPEDNIHNSYDDDDDDKYKALLGFTSEIHKLILKYQDCADIVLYTEYSKTGRIHFHGIILFKDIFKAYFFLLPKLSAYGFIEIDSIHLLQCLENCKEDEEDGLAKWISYCTKLYDTWPIDIHHHFDNLPRVTITKTGTKIKHKQSVLKC